MKSKLLLLSFLMLFTFTTNYAQSSAEQAGIAVQGIARDANNTAIANESISFTFELYYLNASNIETEIFSKTLNLQTDAFGVFSYVIDPLAVNNSKFANYQAYLRIKKGSDIISNEKLHHVPYAISANNGVPTGSIVPFIGTDVPYGWALCDGSALPSTATELIAMVGANAPNLQGMFLRGVGTNTMTPVTTTLKGVQDDEFKRHLHNDGTYATDTTGDHTHRTIVGEDKATTYAAIVSDGDGGTKYYLDDPGNDDGTDNPISSLNGDHNHDVTGNSGYTPVTQTTSNGETRPVNYGVHYIIKL